jgi:uronate dehydrogenase
MRRVVVTGAAGRIGSVLRAGLRDQVELLRLVDQAPLGSPAPNEELVHADIGDLAAMERAVDGMDAVVHLAGVPEEDAFEPILQANIAGTYNVFEAARRRGCRRVVYASTSRVTGFYPQQQRVDPEMPVRPDTWYAVSKVFGEALGRFYADRFGLEVVCVRIGAFEERPSESRHLSTWLSPRDAVQLFRCCLTAPDVGLVTLYGVSANRRSWWDTSAHERLGYRPQDDAERYAAEVESLEPQPGPAGGRFDHIQGLAKDIYDR